MYQYKINLLKTLINCGVVNKLHMWKVTSKVLDCCEHIIKYMFNIFHYTIDLVNL